MITLMLYTCLLIIHIAGAVVTGVAAFYTGIVLWRRTSSLYETCSLTLSSLAVFQILYWRHTLDRFRSDYRAILVYRYRTVFAYVALYRDASFRQDEKILMPFPLARTPSPILASLAILLAAISYGF